MRRFPTLAVAAAAAAAIALTVSSLAGTAVAGTPTGTGTGAGGRTADNPISAYLASLPAGYQDNQVVLLDFNTRLKSLPGVDRAGYVGSVDDVAGRSTTVYWHGAPALLDRLRPLASQLGIGLKVAAWPYDAAQIAAMSRKLLHAARTGAIAGFTGSAVVGFDPATPGLELEGSYTARPGAAAPAPAAVASQAASIAGAPVTVLPGTAGGAADGSRDSDYAPFYAGGLMYSPSGGEICSSGFAVHYSGADHITTARHCRPSDFEAVDNTSAKYGSTTAWADGGQGRVMSAGGAAFAFDGAWNSTSYWKGVVGFRDLSVGDSVCTDGANSGVHCGVQVTKLTVYWDDGYGSEPTIEAYRSAGVAVIQGDSGGPVLVPLSNGTQIYAAGMIQRWAGTNLNPNCGGTWYTGSNACSATVGFTSMRTVVNSLSGATLTTTS